MLVGWVSFLGTHTSITAISKRTSSVLPAKAYPVFGIALEYDDDLDNKGSLDDRVSHSISVVYALPDIPSSFMKGIVLLLHACTHNAYKFFSPSEQCPKCIGLSEELEISRWVLEHGYVALAVTSSDLKSGCWGDASDVRRIQRVLDEFLHATHPNLFTLNGNTNRPIVYAVGASSGGTMAARLLAEDVVDAALVMVMGLSHQLLDKLVHGNQSSATASKTKSLYLAPMINDKGTAQRSRDNFQYLSQYIQDHPSTNVRVILDETSCQSIPVTADYLSSRVPGMTQEAAEIIVESLLEAKHLDRNTHLLIVDPTQSQWRKLLTARSQQIPLSLLQAASQNVQPQTSVHPPNQDMLLWDTFDLTPGKSSLAKALHRAWAFHEYCSESLSPAFTFFES
jgi:hypothetical protein